MKKTAIILVLLLGVLISASPALAAYTFTTSIPGTNIVAGQVAPGNSSIVQYIALLYNGALALVGLLAFIAIVYWGVRYTISGGNASKVADARDGILQAILGLVLLLCGYLILRTINPELVNLQSLDDRLSKAAITLPYVSNGGFLLISAPPAANAPNLGKPCPQNACGPNLQCSAAGGTAGLCVPPGVSSNGPGKPCVYQNTDCLPGLVCDITTGTCKQNGPGVTPKPGGPVPAGGTCIFAGDCQAGLSCIGSKCWAVSYQPPSTAPNANQQNPQPVGNPGTVQ